MSKQTKYQELFAKIEQIPGLTHGPGDDGSDESRAFDPAQSDLIKWLQANLDRDWLYNLVFWNVFKASGAIFWDPDKKVWRGRSVAEYEKKRAASQAVKVANKLAKAAAKAARPKRKRGRERDVPTEILVDAVAEFHALHKHQPTSMELLAVMKTQEFMALQPSGKPISESTFWKRLREARDAVVNAPHRLVFQAGTRGTKSVDELIIPEFDPKSPVFKAEPKRTRLEPETKAAPKDAGPRPACATAEWKVENGRWVGPIIIPKM